MLADKNFKAAIINSYKDVKENDYNEWKDEKSQKKIKKI